MNMPSFLKPLDIEAEKQEILKILRSNEALKDYTPLELDFLNLLMNAFLYRLNLKIDELNYIIANNYIDFSQGEFLDALVALGGIERLKGSEPIASVSIEAKANCFLPKNTKFLSEDGAVAFLSEDKDLIEGENIAYLISDTEGEWKTEILELNNPLITKIKILSNFKKYEQKESDEALKKRFLKSLSRTSTAGSEESYSFYAQVDGVKKVKCFSEKKGEVTIIFQGEEALKAEIEKSLEGNIPLTDSIVIKKANEIKQDLSIRLRATSKAKLDDIYKAIKNNIQSYFDALGIGEKITGNKLKALCFVNNEIIDVDISDFKEIDKESIYTLGEITFQRLEL